MKALSLLEAAKLLQNIADTAASLLHKVAPDEAKRFRADGALIRAAIEAVEPRKAPTKPAAKLPKPPAWTMEEIAQARPVANKEAALAGLSDDFCIAVSVYLDACAEDYRPFAASLGAQFPLLQKNADDEVREFRAGLKILPGRRFIRIIRVQEFNGHVSRSVHSFIEKVNGNIWKAAGWKAPALNFPRGNIFKRESYKNSAKWTGAQ
jgi:hypothetical protein